MNLRLAAWLAIPALSACASGPEPLRWGVDACDRCRMILTDKRFGAEWVDGRPYKFDGVDELARFLADHPAKGAAFVTDGMSGALIPADQAVYLSSPGIISPMGGHIMSFASRAEAERYASRQALEGYRLLSFSEALSSLKSETPHAGH